MNIGKSTGETATGETATEGRQAERAEAERGQAGAGPSPIAFRLDPGSGVPTYLQLVHQVEEALRLGYLARGDQLPRVKDAVGCLAINPNTVLKAYRELEHRGLAAGRPGQGTFVVGTLGRPAAEQQAQLRKRLLAWIGDADAAGLGPEAMTALFGAALRDYGDATAAAPSRGRRRPGQAWATGREGAA